MSRLLAVGVLLSAFVWAQSPRGSIVGRVTDTTASSLAGAKVVVVNTKTGASSSTVTADGEYTIPSPRSRSLSRDCLCTRWSAKTCSGASANSS